MFWDEAGNLDEVPPHPRYRPAASSVHYTTSCKHSLVLLRMGEIIAQNMLSWLKPLLLHLVGCLYYCISDALSYKRHILSLSFHEALPGKIQTPEDHAKLYIFLTMSCLWVLLSSTKKPFDLAYFLVIVLGVRNSFLFWGKQVGVTVIYIWTVLVKWAMRGYLVFLYNNCRNALIDSSAMHSLQWTSWIILHRLKGFLNDRNLIFRHMTVS